MQPIFSVYTVARFGPEVDLGLPDVRDRFAPVPLGPGPGRGGGPRRCPSRVPSACPTPCSTAATGPPWDNSGPPTSSPTSPATIPFNEQRVPRVRDKYFIQYLMALLQRLVVHRAIGQAGAILAKSGPEQRWEPLEALRGDLLRFAVGGHFTQVSTRHALHRYYQVAREGLGRPDRLVGGSAGDRRHRRQARPWRSRTRSPWDGREHEGDGGGRRRPRRRSPTRWTRTWGSSPEVQRMVHYIEMAIVSVYFAHLWHMFAENDSLKEWVNEKTHLHGAGDWFVSIGVLTWAVIGFGLALMLGRVLHRKVRGTRDRQATLGRSTDPVRVESTDCGRSTRDYDGSAHSKT